MGTIRGNNLLAIVAIYCAAFGYLGWATQAELQKFNNQLIDLQTDRLSSFIKPTKYDINLDFVGAIDDPSKPMHYTGSVRIDVKFFGPSLMENIKSGYEKISGKFKQCTGNFPCDPNEKVLTFISNQIVMHADKDVEITGVEVFLEDKNKLSPMKIVKTGRDIGKQLILLEMNRALPPGGRVGQIRMNFKAPIRDDLHGVYLSSSKRNEHVYRHIVAKFQPTFARLALPCFDEPRFKAQFALTLNYDMSKPGRPMEAYANTYGDTDTHEKRHTTKFELTPTMPIHMVAFIVGSFNTAPLAIQVRPDLELRFLGVPDRLGEGVFALQTAKKAIAWFENYIDYKFPLKKLDIVAIGDTDTDNTETWGLVFIRESVVVIDEQTQLTSRIAAAVNVAHVVVHQWFANLVTAEWWDDLWLTESVAAQMAYDIVDQAYPDYQSEYFVRISTLSNILAKDKSGDMHSLSPPEDKLSTSAQIYEIFDLLSFMKSGALARMVQNTIGRDHFRMALKKLVKKFANNNFNFQDFMACIRETGKPGESMHATERTLRSFSKLSGFPVVNVDLGNYLGHESLLAYLEPFEKEARVGHDVSGFFGTTLDYAWRTPLEVVVSDASGLQQETIQFDWGVDLHAIADLPDWFNHDKHYLKVQPNPDFSTYYRIRYSDRLLSKLKTPIEDKQLSPMDRLHILDDANALVGSQLMKNDTFRELVDCYQNENNPAVLIEMLIAAQTLAKLQVTNKEPSPSIKLFKKLFIDDGFRVTGKETALEQRARSATLKALVDGGDDQVIGAALETFDSGTIALFLREPVYNAVVKKGTKDQVHQLADSLLETNSPEERMRLASALAQSDDTQILKRLMSALNEPYSFKANAVKQIVQSAPRLALEDGLVVIKSDD